MNWLKRLRDRTVFAKIHEDAHPNHVIATLFHRTAATLYLIYFLWGLVSLFTTIPSLVMAHSAEWQDFFSLMVMPVALTACIGATFFPSTGRTEMYAASTFAFLVSVYLVYLAIPAFHGDQARMATLVLSCAHLVVPISRSAFVYLTLVKQAKILRWRQRNER